MKKSVLVAVSGGVDSTVASALLKEQGYDVIAVTMKLYCNALSVSDRSCCNLDSIQTASKSMKKIDVKHFVYDVQDLFRKKVIEPFFEDYISGVTPNPCVSCNQYVRFPVLFKLAEKFSCDYVATGHYARIIKKNSSHYIAKGKSKEKDQSYFLWGLKRDYLPKIIFPVGDLEKDEVRQIAMKFDLPSSNREESQDICFLSEGGYREELEKKDFSRNKGYIVDTKGNILKEHNGIWNFTIGQRRGLGIATGEPLYVLKINSQANTVVVGKREELYSSKVNIRNCNWIGIDNIVDSFCAKGCIRYRSEPSNCKVKLMDERNAFVEFKKPQRAITPGQSLVLYDGDIVLGGGIISI